jgi:transcriptional regulator with GAF, ATPase, and Fis domain
MNINDTGIIDKEHLHLKIVHEISDIINQSIGLETILKSVVKKIGESLNFDVVSIYILNDKKKHLQLKAGNFTSPGRGPYRTCFYNHAYSERNTGLSSSKL